LALPATPPGRGRDRTPRVPRGYETPPPLHRHPYGPRLWRDPIVGAYSIRPHWPPAVAPKKVGALAGLRLATRLRAMELATLGPIRLRVRDVARFGGVPSPPEADDAG